MFKVSIASTEAFEVFDLPVKGLDRSIWKSAIIDISRAMAFDHDEWVDDVIMIPDKQIRKIDEYGITALIILSNKII